MVSSWSLLTLRIKAGENLKEHSLKFDTIGGRAGLVIVVSLQNSQLFFIQSNWQIIIPAELKFGGRTAIIFRNNSMKKKMKCDSYVVV